MAPRYTTPEYLNGADEVISLLQDIRLGAGFSIASSRVPGISGAHTIGHNDAATNVFEPISIGGVYQTPQVAGAITLRIKAGGDAADDAAGVGAREVTFVGLDETGALAVEAVATAGASASLATTTTFIRMFDAHVSASGRYATAAVGSHVGSIVIEDTGGTPLEWGTISATDFPRGETQIGARSVPLGQIAYVESLTVIVDNAKAADVIMFVRPNILETAAPYSVMEVEFLADGVADSLSVGSSSPMGPYPALTDFGFMGKVASGTGHITIDFEITTEDA